MKNKEKFKKICSIISKVLLILLCAILIFLVSVVLFKSCNNAFASESDGIGSWVFNDSFVFHNGVFSPGGTRALNFNFRCDNIDYTSMTLDRPFTGLHYVNDNGSTLVYNDDRGSWVNAKYKTIDVTESISGDTLAWLSANATYQNPTPIETYSVTKNVTNGTMPGGADTIQTGGTANYQIAPNNGYTFPQSISVVNAEYTYNKETGAITISNPTGNVVIYVNCVRSDPTGVDLLGYFRFNDVLTIPTENFNQTMRFEPMFSDGLYYFTELQLILSNGNLTMRFLDSDLNWVIVYETSQGWIRTDYQAISIGSPVAVSGAFNTWFSDNTVTLDNDASGSYNQGYTDGFNAGNSSGYNKGYNAGLTAGQSAGYQDGYNKGYTDGQQILGGTEGLIAGTSNLFTMKIFGTFSILDILLIVFGIGMGIWFLKMFAGG